MVAHVAVLARAAFRSAAGSSSPLGSATAGYPPLGDSPGEYVLQR